MASSVMERVEKWRAKRKASTGTSSDAPVGSNVDYNGSTSSLSSNSGSLSGQVFPPAEDVKALKNTMNPVPEESIESVKTMVQEFCSRCQKLGEEISLIETTVSNLESKSCTYKQSNEIEEGSFSCSGDLRSKESKRRELENNFHILDGIPDKGNESLVLGDEASRVVVRSLESSKGVQTEEHSSAQGSLKVRPEKEAELLFSVTHRQHLHRDHRHKHRKSDVKRSATVEIHRHFSAKEAAVQVNPDEIFEQISKKALASQKHSTNSGASEDKTAENVASLFPSIATKEKQLEKVENSVEPVMKYSKKKPRGLVTSASLTCLSAPTKSALKQSTSKDFRPHVRQIPTCLIVQSYFGKDPTVLQ